MVLHKKLLLIFFGLFLATFIIEAGLRIGEFILISLQERTNILSLKREGAYRIMCLGESTTFREYPLYLEEILNSSKAVDIKFTVIDKSVPSITTDAILLTLEDNLDKYKPDMVITMMGINDSGGVHIPYEELDILTKKSFLDQFKIYKLARFLKLHIAIKLKDIQLVIQKMNKVSNSPKYRSFTTLEYYYPKSNDFNFFQAERYFRKAIELNSKDDGAYVELGSICDYQGEFIQAEQYFIKAIELNPKNDVAYSRLGWVCVKQGADKFPQAEYYFNKAIELNPTDSGAYAGLASIYDTQGKFPQAEQYFIKAIELNPKNDVAYSRLGWVCVKQGADKFPQAEYYFNKAIELNPTDSGAYAGLASIYDTQGKFPQAEQYFIKAIELNPKNDVAYSRLGWVCVKQGADKFPQAEYYFNKAIELNPTDSGGAAMAAIYTKMNKEGYWHYFEKANKLRGGYYNPTIITVRNYHKLREILKKRNITYVCVQYPIRSIEPLKQIFPNDDQIVFVDNEKIFKQTVAKSGYEEYFKDIFAGDFGHCTEKGNRLLAENIAEAILKEAFGKNAYKKNN